MENHLSDKVNEFVEEHTGIDLGVSDRDIAFGVMVGGFGGAAVLSTFVARNYYNDYRARAEQERIRIEEERLEYEKLYNEVNIDGSLPLDDPREAMATEMLSRGYASMDEILQASFGEWPPKGLDIVMANPQIVSFGDIADRPPDPERPNFIVYGDAMLHGERRIRMNHEVLAERMSVIERSAYTSTLGHEGVHILQGDNVYRASEIYGPGSRDVQHGHQMVIGAHDPLRTIFRDHINTEVTSAFSTDNTKHLEYLSEGVETQARIHEVIIDGYQRWGQVPATREEFLVAMHNSGINIPDEVMDTVRSSPTFEASNRIFGVASPHVSQPIDDINFSTNALTPQGQAEFWNEGATRLYVDLIEMYGDGPGRARFDMGVNMRPELRATYDAQPKFDHSQNTQFRTTVENLVEQRYQSARMQYIAKGGDPDVFDFDRERMTNTLINQYQAADNIETIIGNMNEEASRLSEANRLAGAYTEAYLGFQNKLIDGLGVEAPDIDMSDVYSRFFAELEEGGPQAIRMHIETYDDISAQDIRSFAYAQNALHGDQAPPLENIRNMLGSRGGNRLVTFMNETIDAVNAEFPDADPIRNIERPMSSQHELLEEIVRDYMSEKRQLLQMQYELRNGTLDGFEFDEQGRIDRAMRLVRNDDNLTETIGRYRESTADVTQRRQLLADYQEAYTRYHELLTEVTGADPREIRGTAISSSFSREFEEGGSERIQNLINGYRNVTPEDLRVYMEAEAAIRVDSRPGAIFDPNTPTSTSPNAMRGSLGGYVGDEIFERIDAVIAEYNERFPDRTPLSRPSLEPPEIHPAMLDSSVWRNGQTEGGVFVFRTSINELGQEEADKLIQSLRGHGLNPNVVESASLGPSIELTFNDYAQLDQMQRLNALPEIHPAILDVDAWQVAETERGVVITRMPVADMPQDEIDKVMQSLQAQGLSPQLHESSTLGTTIRLSGSEVIELQTIQSANAEASTTPRATGEPNIEAAVLEEPDARPSLNGTGVAGPQQEPSVVETPRYGTFTIESDGRLNYVVDIESVSSFSEAYEEAISIARQTGVNGSVHLGDGMSIPVDANSVLDDRALRMADRRLEMLNRAEIETVRVNDPHANIRNILDEFERDIFSLAEELSMAEHSRLEFERLNAGDPNEILYDHRDPSYGDAAKVQDVEARIAEALRQNPDIDVREMLNTLAEQVSREGTILDIAIERYKVALENGTDFDIDEVRGALRQLGDSDLTATLINETLADLNIQVLDFTGAPDTLAVEDTPDREALPLPNDTEDPSLQGDLTEEPDVRPSSVAGVAADAGSEVAETAADMARANDVVQAGSRMARMAKIGVISAVAATGAAVVLTRVEFDSREENAIELAQNEELIQRMVGETDEEFTARTQDALDSFLEMHDHVESVVIGETTLNQTPIIGVIIGMAATETYAMEQFAQWRAEFGPIDEDVFQALKMDMLGGQSLGAEFAMAGREMIPDTMSEFPESLHALWAAGQELDRAEARADVRATSRSRDEGVQARAEARYAERQEALAEAKALYQEEFSAALSDPETASELLSLMPQDLLMQMVEATIQSRGDNADPALLEFLEARQAIENSMGRGTGGPGDYAVRQQAEQRMEALTRENSDLIHDYIREVFGGVDVSADGAEPSQDTEIEQGRFAGMGAEEQSAVIDDLILAAMDSEDLKSVHPYIREIADLTARADYLETRLEASRMNQSNRTRMEGEQNRIEERLEVIRAEFSENPEILDSAAEHSETIDQLLGDEAPAIIEEDLIADVQIPQGPFDNVAGDPDLLAEAQEVGIEFDVAQIVSDPATELSHAQGLSVPQV